MKTSLSSNFHADLDKNNILIRCNPSVMRDFLKIKIKLFRRKRFLDGRCTYKNTGSNKKTKETSCFTQFYLLIVY